MTAGCATCGGSTVASMTWLGEDRWRYNRCTDCARTPIPELDGPGVVADEDRQAELASEAAEYAWIEAQRD